MKKKQCMAWLAAAALCPWAAAQSSVTVFGVVDMAVRHLSYSGNGSVNSMGSYSGAPSLIGFRGSEDVGGGLTAAYWIESGIMPDTGRSAGQDFGVGFWNRASWVSLGDARLGTLRLGRDFSPSYWGQWAYDPATNLGVGDQTRLAHADPVMWWRNNSVQYLTPDGLGGFSARLMHSAGEGGAEGSYTGARVAYVAGALNVAGSYGKTSHARGGDYKFTSVGANYDLGVIKPMAFLARNALGPMTESRWNVGLTAPMGADTVWASYGAVQTNAAGQAGGWYGANMFAVGMRHPLSKRVAVYANASRLKNKGNGVLNVEQPGSYSSRTRPGGSNTGLEAGMFIAF